MDRDWQLEPDVLRDRLTRIIDQVERMVHIIEHIRMFAREAGAPKVEPVLINNVVAGACDLLDAQLRAQGVTLKLSLGDELPTVTTNMFSLEEVLLNLLTNAHDAVGSRTDEASRIEVVTRRDGVDRVPLEVVDNGGGIPESIEQQIFDPFFTTKDPDQDTGLGLAISKSIVEQVHGDLSIASSNGDGTRFVISLPVSLAEDTPLASSGKTG